MNPLVAYQAAIARMNELHREAEHARLVRSIRREARSHRPLRPRKLLGRRPITATR